MGVSAWVACALRARAAHAADVRARVRPARARAASECLAAIAGYLALGARGAAAVLGACAAGHRRARGARRAATSGAICWPRPRLSPYGRRCAARLAAAPPAVGLRGGLARGDCRPGRLPRVHRRDRTRAAASSTPLVVGRRPRPPRSPSPSPPFAIPDFREGRWPPSPAPAPSRARFRGGKGARRCATIARLLRERMRRPRGRENAGAKGGGESTF